MATFFGKNKNIDKHLEKTFSPNLKFGKFMYVDEVNKLIMVSVKDRYKPTYLLKYDNLIDYSISANEKEIKSKSGIGRAITGGILFGTTGAVVGAVTGKKEASSEINQLLINLELNFDGKTTKENIPLIVLRSVKTDSNEYKTIENELVKISDFLESIK